MLRRRPKYARGGKSNLTLILHYKMALKIHLHAVKQLTRMFQFSLLREAIPLNLARKFHFMENLRFRFQI